MDDTINLIAGGVLALLFEYIPGLSDWYDKLAPAHKRLVMACALLVVAIGMGIYAWRGGADPQSAFASAVRAFLAALVASQGAHALTKK